jgi:hypothetical protein
MRTRLFLLLLALTAWCRAEIIDRVAATVGARAITQSDVLKEIRLSAFLNRAEPDFGPASRRAAAERMVERALAESEMETGQYPAADESEVTAQLAVVRKQYSSSQDAWIKALAGHGIREGDLRLHLLRQVALLRFIDARFGPGVQVLEEDLRAYYEGRFTKEWENKSKKPRPAFDEVRAGIEEVVRAQRVDALLDQWLKEARERTRIEFKPEAFQ